MSLIGTFTTCDLRLFDLIKMMKVDEPIRAPTRGRDDKNSGRCPHEVKYRC